MTPTCDACKHWRPTGLYESNGEALGHCKQGPPQHNLPTHNGAIGRGRWLLTLASEECGAFTPIHTPEAEPGPTPEAEAQAGTPAETGPEAEEPASAPADDQGKAKKRRSK